MKIRMKTSQAIFVVILGTLLLTANDVFGGRAKINNRILYKPDLIPRPQHSDENYYNNKDRARITKTSHFEQTYTLGQKITFVCEATGVPRPEITWLKNGYELLDHRFFTVRETHVDNATIKSKMEIEPATQKDADFYECRADNLYAIDRRSFYTSFITMLL